MALRYFTLSSSLCAETIVGAWEVRLEKNMERVRAMLGISFYLYEVGSAGAEGLPMAIVRSFQSDRGIDQEAERGEIRFRKPRGRLLKIYTKTAS